MGIFQTGIRSGRGFLNVPGVCDIGRDEATAASSTTRPPDGSISKPSSAASVSFVVNAPESAKPVVTRFAPSPTGFLHVGGARTALFNWAYARRHGGRFILRMEDTDQLRSSEESTLKIVRDLAWLGIDWDEGPDPNAPDPMQHQIGEHGPYFQSQRLPLYREALQKLLDRHLAYEAFETPDELAERRATATRAGENYRYDSSAALSLTPEQIRQYKEEGRPYVVRFRVPEKTFTVEDRILGTVSIASSEIEDFVIWKADGFPTYHFAVVVDDIMMGVTDVLRGQEHLMNTPKHLALYEALEQAPPRYAHLPLIFNPDGSKMSKRDKAKAARAAAKTWLAQNGGDQQKLAAAAGLAGADLEDFLQKRKDDVALAAAIAQATGVHLPEIDIHDFRVSGYLPEALVKYLALLGWSPKNDQEDIDPETLAKLFDVSGIGKSPARFDRVKLMTVDADEIRRLLAEEFHRRLRQYFTEFHPEFVRLLTPPQFEVFAISYKERARTLAEPAEAGCFFVCDDEAVRYDPAAVRKALLANEGAGMRLLSELLPELMQVETWSSEILEQKVEEFLRARELGLGKIGQPLRVAISGGTVTPPLFDTMAILGKERALRRIERCLKLHGHTSARSAQS
jgi:glutamyl-tRNA synthetase